MTQDFTRNPSVSCDSRVFKRSAGQTETGLVRSNNQDAILLDEPIGLWLVADGMGGHAGGAEASRLASVTIQAAVREGATLHSSILAAHYAIRAEQSKTPALAEMGTTIVALLEADENYEVAWVGDSRAYLFDSNSGNLQQLTRDHNLAGLMVETGALSQAEAARHPRRHVLTDCLGLHGAQEPRIEHVKAEWGVGQSVLLCSDGLSGELGDEEIAAVLAEDSNIINLVQTLLQRAIDAGARDNVSVVLIQSPSDPTLGAQVRKAWGGWLRRSR